MSEPITHTIFNGNCNYTITHQSDSPDFNITFPNGLDKAGDPSYQKLAITATHLKVLGQLIADALSHSEEIRRLIQNQ